MATGKRIVIVEDTAPIAEALQLKLKAIGHDVVVCDDGELAVAEITKQKPDLVVSDIIMPKIDGFGVVAAAKKAHPDVQIVIFSDLAQEEDRKRMTELGVKDYIVKSATSLSDAVKKIDAYATGKDPNAKPAPAPAQQKAIPAAHTPSTPVSPKDTLHPKNDSKEISKPASIPKINIPHTPPLVHTSPKSPAPAPAHTPTSHTSHETHSPEHPPLVVPKPPKKPIVSSTSHGAINTPTPKSGRGHDQGAVK